MKKIFIIIILTLIVLVTSCSENNKNSVVVYTSVDRNHSQPIFESFEKETNIEVLAVYDVEATKTIGLANRLINEKNNPKADVFWNGEILQTIKLKENNVLEKYISNNTNLIPDKYIDFENYYSSFGGRLKVFLVNTNILDESDYPNSILDLINNNKIESNKIAISNPVFGTTSTYVAALYALLGENSTYDLFSTILSKKVNILNGNAQVRDLVSNGKLSYGLTDSDDALSAINKGYPVKIIIPDQNKDSFGTLLIPNTVSLIKNGPNKKNGELFIDFLLDISTTEKLIDSGWIQIPLRKTNNENIINISTIKTMDINYEDIYKIYNNSSNDMIDLFIK